MVGWLWVGCGASESSIKARIDAANTCETKEDCAKLGGKCPFGCHILVHKEKQAEIKALIDGYATNCAYDCIAIKEVTCEQKKCKAVPCDAGNCP